MQWDHRSVRYSSISSTARDITADSSLITDRSRCRKRVARTQGRGSQRSRVSLSDDRRYRRPHRCALPAIQESTSQRCHNEALPQTDRGRHGSGVDYEERYVWDQPEMRLWRPFRALSLRGRPSFPGLRPGLTRGALSGRDQRAGPTERWGPSHTPPRTCARRGAGGPWASGALRAGCDSWSNRHRHRHGVGGGQRS